MNGNAVLYGHDIGPPCMQSRARGHRGFNPPPSLLAAVTLALAFSFSFSCSFSFSLSLSLFLLFSLSLFFCSSQPVSLLPLTKNIQRQRHDQNDRHGVDNGHT